MYSINADYFDLTEEIKTNPEAPEFEVNDKAGNAKYKNSIG